MSDSSASKTVKVGIYQNEPKVFTDYDGKPQGIFIDIIEYIAEKEGWKVSYVDGTWDKGLERLNNGEIDLMTDVSFSKERTEAYDFHKINLLNDWRIIYTKDSLDLEQLEDLNNRTIITLEKSVQLDYFVKLIEDSGIKCKIVTAPDYAGMVKAVKLGKADGMLASRFFMHSSKFPEWLKPSGIVLLNYTPTFFASSKGKNEDILSAIDKHLSIARNNIDSVYYRSLERWLGEKTVEMIPRLILFALAGLILFVSITLGLSVFLKKQVSKRTAELKVSNQQLEMSLEKLKMAQMEILRKDRLHVLGELASGVAHDINNILGPVKGYAELMLTIPEKMSDKQEVKEYFEIIKKAADDGTALVESLRNFYQRKADDKEVDSVDINDLLEDVIKFAKPKIMESSKRTGKEISVKTDFGKIPSFYGKKTELRELFLNLIINAVDAMPEGGTLSLITEYKEGIVSITVSDTGTGMTPEVKDKCLMPFFTTKGEKGTGMGLAVAENLVNLHRGSIDIRTQLGQGTSFIIKLPTDNNMNVLIWQ